MRGRTPAVPVLQGSVTAAHVGAKLGPGAIPGTRGFRQVGPCRTGWALPCANAASRLSYGSQQDGWEPGLSCCCSHKEKPLSVQITLEHLTGSLRNPKKEKCTPRCCN